MSTIGKTKATAIYHEWQTDELNTPGNSRIGEGTDYILPGAAGTVGLGGAPEANSIPSALDGPGEAGGGADAVAGGPAFNPIGANRTRLGNYTQINGKTISISGTRRAIDQAGVADEYAYQLKKRGTELRRDVEFDLIHAWNVSGQVTSTGRVGADTGARTFGGFQSWINDPRTCIFASGSAVAAADAGSGSTVPTLVAQGERSPLALSHIDQAMQNLYEQGGKANKLMLSPKLRRDFSDLMVTDSGVRRNIDMDGKLRQSVDIYMSDFGDVMVVPNYVMGLRTVAGTGTTQYQNSCALLYDPMWFAIATLRPLQEIDVGQRGDSTIGMMVEEMTLEVKNPIGCGAIYNLN